MKIIWQSFKVLLWMTLLTGFIYPLLITAIAQLFFTKPANGSLVEVDGHIRGSELIAQKFTDERYFWPRPSAVDYNALASGGSNFGPTSAELKELVDTRRKGIVAKNGGELSNVPVELLFASGSGLDPHLSPEAAYYQVERVAKARKMDPAVIRQVIEEHAETPPLRLLGKTRVNVLMLNIYLDQIEQAKKKNG